MATKKAPAGIRLTLQEQRSVISRALRLMQEKPELTPVQVFRSAMDKLPAKRRGKAEYPSNAPWYPRMLAEAMPPAPQPETEPRPEPQPQAAPPAPERRAADVLAAALGEALTLLLADALRSPILRDSIRRAFDVETAAVVPTPNQTFEPVRPPSVLTPPGPAATEPPPAKRVLVVGLLGQQANDVARLGPGLGMDFKFMKDDTAQRMRENAKSADIVVGMIGFMSHGQERALRDVAKDYRRVNGGVSELKRLLNIIGGSQ